MNKVTTDSVKIRDQVIAYIEQTCSADPEHLWEKYPEYEVFRHSATDGKGKWFALIANVTYEQIGVDADDPAAIIFVAVVKCDPELVQELRHEGGFAPAYHMNKHRWISILLDGSAPMDAIEKRIDESFSLTA